MAKPPTRVLKPTPPKSPPKKTQAAPVKKFSVKPWTGEGEGEKILGYGKTGMGKTTLFSMLPNPIFMGLDNGGRMIVNPKTGKPINHIPDVEVFEDVQAVLQQKNLFPRGSTLVIDTVTLLEQLIIKYVVETVALPKGGKARNIKHYGYNEGSSHAVDHFRLILQDLDALIRRGVNAGLICQEQAVKTTNPEGSDYLQAGPRLHHDNQYSLMLEACEWADHIFRINYLNTVVRVEKDRVVGKIAPNQDTTRAIYIGGGQDHMAKHKLMGKLIDENGEKIEIVSFDDPADDSLWTYIFGE